MSPLSCKNKLYFTTTILIINYLTEYDSDDIGGNLEYYDRSQHFADPVTQKQVEALSQLEEAVSPISVRFEQAPTTSSITGNSIANAINLRGK